MSRMEPESLSWGLPAFSAALVLRGAVFENNCFCDREPISIVALKGSDIGTAIAMQPTHPNNHQGKVYLIGAGPGNLDYLTVRGQQLLAQANALIYDALADPRLLQWVPDDCLKRQVGKRGGKPSMPQSEINQLLVDQCQQGKQVVRLKGGDPFIFGRCVAEIQALKAANCDFEVVPGISSALAAPLLASIPLTDPVFSRCFAVFSAHDPEALEWEALSKLETLVILMGGRQLSDIVRQLRRYRRSPQTPVAIIRWAGRPQQEIWIGTLATILEQTAGISLSPTVMVIGAVVGLRDYLRSQGSGHQRAEVRKRGEFDQPQTLKRGSERWEDGEQSIDRGVGILATNRASASLSATQQPVAQRPLEGKTVLVTRAAGQSSQFCDRLQQLGAQVVEMPALEIGPPSSWQGLDDAIANLQTFDWLILTSTNGVDYFFQRLAAQGKDARALAGVKIALVGKKTAASLTQQGLRADFIPPDFVADSLVAHFPEDLDGKKVLFPRVETGGRAVLVKALSAKGAEVTEVAAYQSGCPGAIAPPTLQALKTQRPDVITFASSKTVKCFCQLLEQTPEIPSLTTLVEPFCIASIGPQTSKTCHQLLGRVDVEATEYTLDGLSQAIVQWSQDLDLKKIV